MRTYNVQVDRYGAEITIGKVSRETYEYWNNHKRHVVQEHLLHDDTESVPPEHNLHPWYERDECLHINAPEFCDQNVLTITDAHSGEVIIEDSIFEDRFQDNAWVLDSDEETIPNLNGGGLLYCMSVEKGYYEFDDIETDQLFDLSKLTFYLHKINGSFMLSHMKYGNQELSVVSAETDQKDWTFWFDSDFPD